MSRFVAPSLLAADFTYLGRDVEMVNNSQADWIHLDIMDGVFVPNISFGIPVVKAVKSIARKPLDVHLMITHPDNYIEAFFRAGADNITIHMEACTDPYATVQKIRLLGIKAGVSLKPDTPVESLESVISTIDFVLIMSVNPGFGGQTFMPATYDKVRKTRELIKKSGSRALIEVDGGVDLSNAGMLYQAGVNILVAGTTIFRAADPTSMIAALKQASL
ncbi:MAG: ribulose-phosphate 3-epimerase [Bacteroidales bacterium]|nr:ribulose-phosphate 3-epimerase [Bacteroidales bacterium]